jgi:hypothetical protein
VESTVVEVLILNGWGESGSYQVVTCVELKILREFEGRRGGGAWFAGGRTGSEPQSTQPV